MNRRKSKQNTPSQNRRFNIAEKSLKKETPKLDKNCPYCNGLFFKTKEKTKKALELVKNYEFDTFLVGTKIDKKLIAKEENLWTKIGAIYAESLKKDLVREIGMQIEKKTKKQVDFKYPDIIIVIDFVNDKIELQLNPLFIYGEYKKLIRGLPQTKWFCRECMGKGCKHCNFKGKMYEESVEEIIAKKILDKTGAEKEKFHGAGREDIDAKMIGKRPFVIEIIDPIKRKINYKALQKEINQYTKGKVEVFNLKKSSKEQMVLLKTVKLDKTYEITFKCDKPIKESTLKDLEKSFMKITISQQTPTRVSHRRANLVRKREIKSVKCEKLAGNQIKATIKAGSGTYIKELVTGDNGRTKPSFSEVLGCKCEPIKLNVLEVHNTVCMD